VNRGGLCIVWGLAAAGSLLAVSSVARAETDAERGLAIYKRGLSLFSAGDYAAAAQELEKAYALSRHPNNLYYLGECQRRLGELRASHESYRRFAETQGVEKRAELMSKLERMRWERRARLSVSSAPGGAQVSLDGKVLGVTARDGSALQVTIAGGRHVLRLSREGHDATERELAAEFGEPIALSFALRAVERPASTASASRTACPAPLEKGCPSIDRCWSRRSSFLLGAGISAALLSAGALAVGIAYNKRYNDDVQGSANLPTYYGVSALGYALAAVFAGASATTFWLYHRELKRGEERKPRLALAPYFDGGPQLLVGGAF